MFASRTDARTDAALGRPVPVSSTCSWTPATAAAPPTSYCTMCDSESRITSSPGRVCAATDVRLPIVPLGTYTAAALPTSAATRSSRSVTVGSSPHTSSPTSAAAIAARIPASGTVSVSLRRSTVTRASCGAAPMVVVRDHARAIATGALGAVQRLVGEREQLTGAVGVLGEGGAADAHGHGKPAVVGELDDRLRDRVADLLGNQPRITRAGVVHHH